MGLTRTAAPDAPAPGERVIALAGNPNVGKSTLFNALTGMRQHTGNWPGKTVELARGRCASEGRRYLLVDLPGTYSLLAHSPEEEVARDFLCFGGADAAVVVCDATALERNLNLVLQILELCPRTLVCVNLLDEAARKGLKVDLPLLADRLGVPVVGTSARDRTSQARLLSALDALMEAPEPQPRPVRYSAALESAAALLESVLAPLRGRGFGRWLALRLLEGDGELAERAQRALGICFSGLPGFTCALEAARGRLEEQHIAPEQIQELVTSALVRRGEELARAVVRRTRAEGEGRDRKLDRLLTSRCTGYPAMVALLALVLWLTLQGANYPSQLLSQLLFWVQDRLTELFAFLGAPDWLHGVLVLGAYRTLAWVVAVMLPPMAIFFPLFTLLEDAGYLPRVAYNLDRPFQRCHACGKQALTMCMGFGCNAAGVVGCRIIDSPRERLLAILTNSFVPCNGRFPTLIAVITMFFVGTAGGAVSSVLSAALLTGAVLLGVGATLGMTRLLSATLLRGIPSSFALELPPYRRPQIGKVLVRSLLDRTAFVLGRAAAVAAPAGAVLWILANVQPGGVSLLAHLTAFFDPLARVMGLDGVILVAFLLGWPANEIVIPIILMAYLSQGSLLEYESLAQLHTLLAANGWSWLTAACVLLFCLFHWPCSTTLLTVRRETGSWRWTALAAALPTALGVAACTLLCTFVHILGLN